MVGAPTTLVNAEGLKPAAARLTACCDMTPRVSQERIRARPQHLQQDDHERESLAGSMSVIRWDEKAGLRRDAVGSQVIDVLKGTRDKGDRQ
jgi:hypothetical protein